MTKENIRKRITIINDYCNEEDKDNPIYYFCQVYADEGQEIELDCFCIRKNDVNNIDDYSEVERFAIDNIKDCLPIWIKEYQENKT